MTFRRLLLYCLLLCLLAACGCAGENPPPESPDVPSGEPSADEESRVLVPDFSDLPALVSPLVRLYPGDGTLLIEYAEPGMDSSRSRLVNYSLNEDRTLGTVDLGDGAFSVWTQEGGGFAVFDPSAGEIRSYSPSAEPAETVRIRCAEGRIGFLVPGDPGGRMLVYGQTDGTLYFVTPDGKEKTAAGLNPGTYRAVGTADGTFLVAGIGRELYAIGPDGTVKQISAPANVLLAGSGIAAGAVGDHVFFLSLDGNALLSGGGTVAGTVGDHAFFHPSESGDRIFAKTSGPDEYLTAAGDGVFLSVKAEGNRTVLRLYSPADRTVAETETEMAVLAAAITRDGTVVTAVPGEDGRVACRLSDPAQWEKNPMLLETDPAVVLGAVPLPPLDETDEIAKEALEEYNVRFLYEKCELTDGLIEAGVEAVIAEGSPLLHEAERKIAESFGFLPKEVWQRIGGDLPYVVILCTKIPGNAGGLSLEYGGYNVVLIEATGKPSVYLDLFIHETGHAIGNVVRNTRPELLDEWTTLTPPEVLNAVEAGTADGINALTTEFTPDDRTGNVCYVSAYAIKNPEEDRAETLAKLFDTVYAEHDGSLFAHEVLRKKGEHWEKMIRETFSLPEETELFSDFFKKS